ncbi:MAG TPA: bifunctional adenosylcobinamide kinase/adenosylcobinamide-phosphate guanylyltransferase, partial [Streptosporangiaceae bacterium]|nr:bifunctional adenosylcobinamide kinase/adenosylcobinamide-phosphate guanylyltransferase [Streptosporangiaceae bacterium]
GGAGIVRAVEIEVRGSGPTGGWPEPGCPCASCRRGGAEGERRAPFHLVVDGELELPGGSVPAGYRVRELAGGWDVTGPDGARLLAGVRPAAPAEARYDAVLLDLGRDPSQLGLLRARGAVTEGTLVLAGFAGHQVRSGRELARRCRMWRATLPRDGDTFTVPGPPAGSPAGSPARPPAGPERPSWRALVLGGSGSGKSAEAELRVAAEPAVTYVATGKAPGPEDAEWAARVGAHRERRPAWWRTVETGSEAASLSRELTSARGAVLVDSVTTWLAAAMDECGAWDGAPAAAGRLATLVDEVVTAWRHAPAHVVAVSDEVGLGVVPETRAGRMYRDELGRLNQRLAADADEFTVMMAGRPLVTAD